MKKIFFLLVIALAVGACQNKANNEVEKKGSSGKTLEMMIVADKNLYQGEVKEFLDSMFASPQIGLPQPESKFDLVNIPKSSYENSEMFQNHRNIILLDINPDNPNKVYMQIDQYAAPQVVFDFAMTDIAALKENLLKYESVILREIYSAEHRRVIKAFKGMQNYNLTQKVYDKFAFNLMFSNEFQWAKEDVDFAWIRKEAKDFGLGILVDVFPYENQNVFTEQKILDRMDTIMKRHVPASKDSSYMGLERRKNESGEYLAPIVLKTVDFPNSEYCVETRGCWRAFGDFMGGPFVSYTLLSPDKKNVIMLTGYVYCPRNKPWTKRDLLMQAESICWSINWDK